ncbi:MAG: BatD family protein [Pseudomonadota bacterium]
MVGRLAVFFVGLWALPAFATVVATIDRATIDANESFNLSIAMDNMSSVEPDIDALSDDFDVLGARESNNTRIFNGQISQQRLFTYQLMAKREGTLQIPPIRVGNESSKPMVITVRAPDTTDASGRDIFIEVAADRSTTWVQAEVVLTLRVYRAVVVRQATLREPTFDGVDVLIQPLGQDRLFSKQIDGRAYEVSERRYALYPQESGTLDIGEFVYQGRLWQGSRLSSHRLFRSEPLSITVEPIPPPPAQFPDADWLPASSVELSERWNPDSRTIVAGEPVTRELRLTAAGLMGAQLPPLGADTSDGVRVYPDQPELATTDADDGLVAARVERYAVIAKEAGSYTLPAVRVPWFDVDTGRWQVAELAAQSLNVEPAPNAAPNVAAAVPPASDALDSRPPQTVLRLWQAAVAALTLVWLATLLLWWLSRRRTATVQPRRKALADSAGQRRRLIHAAQRAAGEQDFANTAARLREWAKLEFGDGPWSLSALAERLDGQPRQAIDALNRVLYGPGGDIDTAALAAAIGQLSRLGLTRPVRPAADSALAPLSPLGNPRAQ